MDPGEHVGAGDVPEHHRDVLLVRQADRGGPGPARPAGPVDHHAELAVRRRQPGLGVPLKHLAGGVYGRPACALSIGRGSHGKVTAPWQSVRSSIWPDARLREPTVAVTAIDDSVKELYRDLCDSMYAENGLGMAALQIGDNRKMFIVEPKLAGLAGDRAAGRVHQPRGAGDVERRDPGQRRGLPVVPRHLHQGQAADALQRPRDGHRRPDRSRSRARRCSHAACCTRTITSPASCSSTSSGRSSAR